MFLCTDSQPHHERRLLDNGSRWCLIFECDKKRYHCDMLTPARSLEIVQVSCSASTFRTLLRTWLMRLVRFEFLRLLCFSSKLNSEGCGGLWKYYRFHARLRRLQPCLALGWCDSFSLSFCVCSVFPRSLILRDAGAFGNITGSMLGFDVYNLASHLADATRSVRVSAFALFFLEA
jgi:hypothetical protein